MYNTEGELTHGKSYQKGSFGTNVPIEMNKNIHMAKVISVEDDLNVGRIQVFIRGIDESRGTLPYAYPLMSRIVHVMPKVGEIVLVFFADAKKNSQSQKLSNRFWVGPIITNYEHIENDNNDFSYSQDTVLTRNTSGDPYQNPVRVSNKKSKEINIFPVDNKTPPSKQGNLGEVGIIGRNNTDVVQSDNKVTTRAGKHLKNKPLEPNNKNPAYSVLEFVDENSSYGLTAGDEIYLISHKGRFKFKKVLTNSDLTDLRQNTQSMLYGELTIQYLKTLTEVFLSHIHQHPQKEPTYSQNSKYKIEDLRKELQNIEKLLAKNLKIN
jgi:hypothetical protein